MISQLTALPNLPERLHRKDNVKVRRPVEQVKHAPAISILQNENLQVGRVEPRSSVDHVSPVHLAPDIVGHGLQVQSLRDVRGARVPQMPLQLAVKVCARPDGDLDDGLDAAAVLEDGVPQRGHAEAALAQDLDPFEPEAVPVEHLNVLVDALRLRRVAAIGGARARREAKETLVRLVVGPVLGMVGHAEALHVQLRGPAGVVQRDVLVAADEGGLDGEEVAELGGRGLLDRLAVHDEVGQGARHDGGGGRGR